MSVVVEITPVHKESQIKYDFILFNLQHHNIRMKEKKRGRQG